MGKSKSKVVNYLLLFLSLVATFLVCETVLRYLAYQKNQKLITIVLDHPEAWRPPKGQEVFLGSMIMLSRNNRIIYELVPELDVIYTGKKTTTNQKGFRGRMYPEQKPENTIRVLGLGDSFMFGHGVSDGEGYMPVLEMLLNDKYPEKQWQQINTAVPGYNTAMEIEVLKEKGLAYRPDIIIVGFIHNDLNLPNFIYKEADFWSPKKSFLVDLVLNRIDAFNDKVDINLANVDFTESDPDNVPPEYKDIVGWDSYERAMEDLRKIKEENSAEVLVLYFMSDDIISKKSMELAKKLEFHVVDISDDLNEYLSTNSLDKKTLWATETDSHPSALAHSIAASELLSELENLGIVNRRLSTR